MIELVAQVVTRGKVKSKLMTKGNGLSAAKYQVSHHCGVTNILGIQLID